MPDQQSIKFEFMGIASILSNYTLAVPRYQRSFAWTEQQVREFISDILLAHDSNEPDYFIGSIVLLSPKTDKLALDVVDGQQRLATTSILLSSVRNAFGARKKDEMAQSINSEYIQKFNIQTESNEPKLRLNERDNDFYLDGILEQDEAKRTTKKVAIESHKLLKSALEIADEEVEKIFAGNDLERVKSVISYFSQNVKSSLVVVPSSTNAFRVFEALNDRGLPLALSDLVKNFLFGCADTRVHEAQAKWTEMYSQFERTETEASVVDFIRQTWSSHYGMVRKVRLFDRVKERVKKPADAIDIAEKLALSSRTYQALRSGNDPHWNNFSDTVKKNVTSIRYLGVKRPYPTLLAILESAHIKKKQGDALFVVCSLTVRLLVTGKIGQGSVEESFSDSAVKIREGTIKTPSDLKKFYKDGHIWPTDAEFETAFTNCSITTFRIARYLLAAIEVFRGGDPHPELVPNLAPEETSLEHVLPQKLTPAWNMDADEHASLVSRLGNMVILNKVKNQKLGNKGPKEKQSVLAKSALKTTSEVGVTLKATNYTWSAKEIESRQTSLAADAVKIWK